jgi:hypothetical protein
MMFSVDERGKPSYFLFQISQTRMIKAQGNGHKRNMQQFKVKQCVDARG